MASDTWISRRPASGISPSWSTAATLSAACAAARRAAISLCVLHGSQRGGHGRGRREVRSGESRLQRQQRLGPGAVRDPVGRGAPGTEHRGGQGHRVLGLGPGAQRDQPPGVGHAWGLEGGDKKHGIAVAGQHQQSEPLQGHGPVAGQPRQVGTVAEQQRVDPELVHARAHPPQPLPARLVLVVHDGLGHDGAGELAAAATDVALAVAGGAVAASTAAAAAAAPRAW